MRQFFIMNVKRSSVILLILFTSILTTSDKIFETLPGSYVSCIAGFFLTTADTCGIMMPIMNCAKYDVSGPTVFCSQCETDYTLFDQQCLRISDCITYITDQAELGCSDCVAGKEPTGDGKKCLPAIGHCKVYSASTTVSSLSLVCDECQSGYSPIEDGNLCLPSISHCASMVVVAPGNIFECSDCDEGWELLTSNTKCLPAIPHASSYSNLDTVTTQLLVSSCDAGFHVNAAATHCLLEIANCQTHTTSSVFTNQLICSACLSGFVKTNDSLLCLSEIAHCSSLASSSILNEHHQCASCTGGYRLTDDNHLCMPVITNCQTYH